MFLGLLPTVSRPVITSETVAPTTHGTWVRNPAAPHTQTTHQGLDDLEAILQGSSSEDSPIVVHNPLVVPKQLRHHPPPGFFDPTWDLLPPAAALQCHMSLGEPASVALQQPPDDQSSTPKSFRQRRPKPHLSPLVHRAAHWPHDDKTRTPAHIPHCTLPPCMASLIVAATAAAAAGLAAGPLGIAVGLKSGALVMVASGGVCGTAYHALANTDPHHHPTAAYLLDDPELAASASGGYAVPPKSCGAEFMHMLGACWPCGTVEEGLYA